MSYSSICSLFTNNYSSCVKTFRECSYNSEANFYLVSDNRDCFDFDEIKIRLGQQGIKSADSLFFPTKIHEIQLIEFKDSKFSYVKSNIIEKAVDSIYVFNENLKSASILYNNESIVFVLVISSAKNTSPLQTMMAISGYTESSLSSTYKGNFDRKVQSLLNQKFPSITYFYSKLIFVFSNNFIKYVDGLQ